ncbi:MAG: hypothetical protein NTV43_03475 [Methylococcales bacterium]|nr:hypothetical protein [Methylococcales bacterium]
MKFGHLVLLVLMVALGGCASQGSKPDKSVAFTGTGTLIIKPITFQKDAVVRDAVKQECDLDSKLSGFIKQSAAKQYATILTDSNSEAADAQVLALEFEDVQGSGGGAWSGAKSVTVKGSLSQKGKVLGNFKARRYSGGGMFAGYKGTCGILGRCVKTLGRDVAEWLAHPTANAVLGDL